MDLSLIKKWEGLRLKEYICPAGKRTIGYGHVCGLHEHFPAGITKEKAEELLLKDVQKCLIAIDRFIKVPLTENQKTALASLLFNCGEAPIRQTLGKRLNEGNYSAAADIFLWWNKATVNGKLVVLPGLANRRAAERELFLKDV